VATSWWLYHFCEKDKSVGNVTRRKYDLLGDFRLVQIGFSSDRGVPWTMGYRCRFRFRCKTFSLSLFPADTLTPATASGGRSGRGIFYHFEKREKAHKLAGGEIFGQKFEKLSSGDSKFGLVNDVIFKKFVKNQKNPKKTRPV
jgi:hypothetical protein